MTKKQKIIIFILIGSVFIIGVNAAYFYMKNKSKPNLVQQKEGVKSLTEDQIGGFVSEDGFEIGYSEELAKPIITITKNPFKENKEKAYQYLRDKGFDPQSLDPVIMARKGVDVPAEEQGLLNFSDCNTRT